MKRSLFLFFVGLLFISCSDNESDYIAPVVYEPVQVNLDSVPYAKLSDYRFFINDIADLEPNERVTPFRPASELFTDYAEKSRFFYLPENTSGTYVSDADPLAMPVGSVLIKNFHYGNTPNGKLLVETRLLIRKADGWDVANYIWNDAQTDAFYDENGATKDITFTRNGTEQTIAYRIPSRTDCMTCHRNDLVLEPLGFKPQNLNGIFHYPTGTANQLQHLSGLGLLSGVPGQIVSTIDYVNSYEPIEERVRSYFDINCAHCHRDGGNAGYVNLRMGYAATADPAMMGVCVGADLQPPGYSHAKIVAPGNSVGSTLPFMMATDNSFYMMPRIGRTIVHEEGLALINEWIAQLPECE